MKLLNCSFIIFSFCLNVAFGLSFDRYHTQEEIHQYMQDIAKNYPEMATFNVLGTSDQGREIAYLTLTKGDITKVPALYYNGTHHGDEWSSTEGILGLIDYLITNQNDSEVSKLLTQYSFYLQPLVNPDGHQAQTREDANGVDPNRDYAFPEVSEKDAFKTKIIQVMKTLVDKVKFRAAVAYHSGIEEVLWSWCYTGTAAPDRDVLYTLGKTSALAMGFNRYLQSYDDYATQGEFIDYAYMKQGTFALTFEVSDDKTPRESDLARVVANSVKGALAVVQSVKAYDEGYLHLESAPVWSMDDKRDPRWVALEHKLE